MGIGTSLFLIAIGAILRFGVADAIEGLSLSVIGLIFMIVGVIGLVISLFMTTVWTRRGPTERTVVRDREMY